VDQYQVSTDKRSGIVNDPNRADDPEYIVRYDWMKEQRATADPSQAKASSG
jgi:hypothetical protein